MLGIGRRQFRAQHFHRPLLADDLIQRGRPQQLVYGTGQILFFQRVQLFQLLLGLRRLDARLFLENLHPDFLDKVLMPLLHFLRDLLLDILFHGTAGELLGHLVHDRLDHGRHFFRRRPLVQHEVFLHHALQGQQAIPHIRRLHQFERAEFTGPQHHFLRAPDGGAHIEDRVGFQQVLREPLVLLGRGGAAPSPLCRRFLLLFRSLLFAGHVIRQRPGF